MLSSKTNHRQFIPKILAIIALMAIPLFMTVQATADTPPSPTGTPIPTDSNCQSTQATDTTTVDTTEVNNCLKTDPIIHDLNLIVDFLSGVVGVAVVGTIVLGGIQYSLAGDNAQSVAAAKKRITNGLIALVGFIFTFSLLQWLIPGGIFS